MKYLGDGERGSSTLRDKKKKKYVRTLKKKKNTKIHNYFLLSKRKKIEFKFKDLE